jgi:hypothetical protein
MSNGGSAGTIDAMAELVLEIWLDVLGIGGADPDDDFFFLGGDSLTGLEVIERVYGRTGVDIPPMAMYDRVNTIRKMAEWIETEKVK